jgi:hypothetical protein
MAKYEYLLNEEFLQQVDESILSELQCRIIVLNNEENVIDTIEGRTSSGSISLSGTSAIRRTGSLTFIADS